MSDDREPDIFLGDDHWLRFTCWRPDRELNPQYAGIPDVPRYGAIIGHKKTNGEECLGAVRFDLPEVHAVNEASRRGCEAKGIPYHGPYPMWKVESWEPLTLSPSLLCSCGDHGYIRNGKWVRA